MGTNRITTTTTIHHEGEIRGLLAEDPTTGQWTALLSSAVITAPDRRSLLEAVDAHLTR